MNEVRYKRFISQTKRKINPETVPPTKDEVFTHKTIKLHCIANEINIPIAPCFLKIMVDCKTTEKLKYNGWISHSFHHPWVKLHLASVRKLDVVIEDVNALMLAFCVVMYITVYTVKIMTDDRGSDDEKPQIVKQSSVIPIVIEVNLMIKVFYQTSLHEKDLVDLT